VPLVPRIVAGGSKRPLSTVSQPNHLPTTRIMPVSEPLVPPSVLTMLLFESSRLLSVVHWCLWCPPDQVDYFIVVLWVRVLPSVIPTMLSCVARQALLTAHQCLLDHRTFTPLACILLSPPHPHPSSRVTGNMLACHPFHAGHRRMSRNERHSYDSLTVLESALLRWTTARPDICWAVIGTTTCLSRSI
jgi:hypothetical protein